MAHAIPKIVFGPLLTTINFPMPPLGLPEPEQSDSKEHTLEAIAGNRQISVDYIHKTRKLKFGNLNETKIAELQSWFDDWAYNGGQFRYYDDANSVSYKTYQLNKLEFKPKRTSAYAANSYYHQVQLELRRVADEQLVEYTMNVAILNNQAVAVNLESVLFDYTTYKSIKMFCEIRRKTDSSELVGNGWLTAIYKDSTGLWEITPVGSWDGDDPEVGFTMSGQQVQYTSSNMSGSNYSGSMKIKEFQF